MDERTEINTYLEDIQKKYFEIDFFDNDKTIEDSLYSILKEIDMYISKYPEESMFYHMKGVCLYHHPNSDDLILKKTEQAFLKVLALNPQYFWSTFYIGCLYFDQKRYNDSLRYLKLIKKDFFRSRNQIWRDLKTQELIVCCNYYISPTNFNHNMFYELKRSYLSENEENQPVPVEITKCIANLSVRTETHSKEFLGLVSSCLELIEILDFKESLTKYIQILANHVKECCPSKKLNLS